MELTKERLIIIIAAALIILFLGLYILLYNPLIVKLRAEGGECNRIETELLQARKAIDALEAIDKKKMLIAEEDIPLAIGELTSQGKLKGINFISMTPGQIEEPKTAYRVLPIEMEIESTYKGLGIFLGLLDDLEKSLVTVGSFDIKADGKTSSRRKAKLVVNMYLSGQ